MASNVSLFLLWAFQISLLSLVDLDLQSTMPISLLQQTHHRPVDLTVLHKPRSYLV